MLITKHRDIPQSKHHPCHLSHMRLFPPWAPTNTSAGAESESALPGDRPSECSKAHLGPGLSLTEAQVPCGLQSPGEEGKGVGTC